MKQLEPVTIGKNAFAISTEHSGGTALRITAKCGEDELSGMMSCQGRHDHSEEQFEKDVNDFAARLATELAGKIRSRELARKFSQG